MNLKKNEKTILLTLFLLATAFFLLQHYFLTGWDFKVYLLNAKYFFGQGSFFEWTRPPVPPLLLSIFSLFGLIGWKTGEYIYIIFISALFSYSSIKFSEKLKINKIIFYTISLCPLLLMHGLLEGTELLSISLLLLYIATIGQRKAPLYLALSVLTRYQNLVFGIFLLIKKDFIKNIKETVIDLFILGFSLLTWLFYNYIKTGNPLTSIMDSYALVIKFRNYIHIPVSFTEFLIFFCYLLPIALIGLYLVIKKDWKNKKLSYGLAVMAIISFFTIQSYTGTPLRVTRYLFLLIIPISYFSTITISKIKKSRLKAIILIMLLILSFSASILVSFPSWNSYSKNYDKALLTDYNSLQQGMGNCSIASNNYIHLNYAGIESEGAPSHMLLSKKIEQGYRVWLFKSTPEPEYMFNKEFINQYPIINQTNEYILLGNTSLCHQNPQLDTTYLSKINELYEYQFNTSFNITWYELFFTDKSA